MKKKEEGRRRRTREDEDAARSRTALAAAVGCVDSLISGRRARSVRSTPTRVTDACRLDPVGVHQRPTTGGQLCAACSALPPALGHYLFNPVPPPDAERMRGDARPRVVGSPMTSQLTRQNEEVEGRGSLTRTALAAAPTRG
ncbi:hypothetical protein EVAR_98265_1 [Eumeta japonica]|uniref:Uncharacterized protein n=1 Tax=Eumeta variegata TaxID=151549 RepID=A0A4C2A2S1_EUMVA|nr:hypothetical protein EVAR_98265_1 [Eumeta japonica]